MLKLYSKRKAARIVERYADWIGQLSLRYGIPAACVKAILYKELIEIDLLDPAADLAVRLYWLRRRLRPAAGTAPTAPNGKRGLLNKRDSSTGYGQIFGAVAILALNFAVDRGLERYENFGFPAGRRLSPERDEDLRQVWQLLRRDPKANIALAALNLLAAAEEITGQLDFERLTPAELQQVFTRYNADTRQITPYGQEVYRCYLRFRAQEQSPEPALV